MNEWSIQLRKGGLELCILALLAKGERYGYEIVQEMNESGEILLPEGTIYPLLKRLSVEGRLMSDWRESPNGPPRKYYRLTRDGENYLAEIITQWQIFAGFVNRLIGESSDESGNNPRTASDRGIPREIAPLS